MLSRGGRACPATSDELFGALRVYPRCKSKVSGKSNSPAQNNSTHRTAGPRLRVLCLHGYVQNGKVFRDKTGAVRKAMKGCEFVFPDAPHTVAPFDDAPDADVGVGPRGWWHTGQKPTNQGQWVRPAMARTCSGWEDGLASAREDARTHGPFDGVFAFSQGCAVATALLREAAQGTLEPLASVRFAVLVGGFVPRDAQVASALCGAPLSLNTLLVSGGADELIPRPRSEALAALFDPAGVRWFDHPGRHGIPTCTSAFRTCLQQLLAQPNVHSEQTRV